MITNISIKTTKKKKKDFIKESQTYKNENVKKYHNRAIERGEKIKTHLDKSGEGEGRREEAKKHKMIIEKIYTRANREQIMSMCS